MELITKYKTTELIKRSNKDWAYIVCFNLSECERVSKLAKTMNLDIPYPITFNEFVTTRYVRNDLKQVLIDNLDLCLQFHTNITVLGVSANFENPC